MQQLPSLLFYTSCFIFLIALVGAIKTWLFSSALDKETTSQPTG